MLLSGKDESALVGWIPVDSDGRAVKIQNEIDERKFITFIIMIAMHLIGLKIRMVPTQHYVNGIIQKMNITIN